MPEYGFSLTRISPYKDRIAKSGRRSGVFLVNFEHISHVFLVFLLLTLNKQMLGTVPVVTIDTR